MNITITQDNSRVEVLGSNGASIIKKLYELAIDPNNTLTLEGNISSTGAYADHVTYLTTNYPNLIINATKLYMTFRDPHVVSALLAQGVGDGTGITISDLDGITLDGDGGTGKVTFKNNTNIEYFEEFKYFTNMHGGHNGPFRGCTNLKLVSFPADYAPTATDTFVDIKCGFVVPSLKWFLEHTGANEVFPITGWWNIPQEDWFDIYIGNTNNKLEDVVVTSDIVVNERRHLRNSKIKTLTWETNSNIPENFCILCGNLTSLTITGQNVQIGENAFYQCSALLTIIGISNISRFNTKCFFECRNASFDASQISSNITSIGAEVFYGVKVTGSLNLPNITSIGSSSFAATNISSVVDLGSITMIPNHCFRECSNLTSVVLPNNCTKLQEGAFGRCSNLSLINLGSSITEFGNYCFLVCSLLNINPSNLSSAEIIGSEAFNGIASLSGDLVLSHLTRIEAWPFGNQTLGITSADFTGSTFTTITSGLFENQTSLDHVILPATLTTIKGRGQFTNAPLRWIKFLGTTAPTGDGVNSMGISASAKIYVPDAAVNDYKASLTEYASLIYGMSLFATDFPNG